MSLRQTFRSLRRSPAFTTVAILTLALGIGVTTAVVSIADHVLVRSLPFRDSGRLMMMLERDASGGFRTPSAPTALDWQRDAGTARAFEGLTYVRGDGVALRFGDETDNLGAAFVAPEFFEILGVRPTIGRMLIDDDHRPGAPDVTVISHRLWQRRYGGAPAVLGRTLDVDSVATTIVGVLPSGAAYPGFADLWTPISRYKHPEILRQRGFHADSRTIARLRPGVDSAGAVAFMRAVGARLADDYPVEQTGWMPAMFPLQNEIIGSVRPMILALTSAAAAVLLLVCANVASLLLARLTTRTREIAVRGALGASRGRVVRELLTESVVLSAIGGGLGFAVAAGAVNVMQKVAAARLPRAEELAIDGRVLAIAAAATLLTALFCGVWPAIRATRERVGGGGLEALRASRMGSVGGRSEARLRRLLVTVQFALALVLLVGAGLLLQSFRRAAQVDVGFDPRGVLSLRVRPPAGAYDQPQEAAALYTRLMDAARAVPGVEDAAFVQHPPFSAASIYTRLSIEGRPALDSTSQVLYRTVSASYLRTMKMRMFAGRWFDDGDVRAPAGSFVINEAMARRYFGGSVALGQRMTVTRASQARADFGELLTGDVIGIVRNVHQRRSDVSPIPEVYVPYTLETWPWGMLVVRARDGARSIPALVRAVRQVDNRLVAEGAAGEKEFGVMEQAIAGSLEPRRFSMSLIATFAACALVLAAIGMYGVVAYSVARRTQEIGVRKALGATDGSIARLMFREALVVVAAGVPLGGLGAWGSARLIRGLLFETGVVDVGTYVATVGLLAGVALLATYLPARRAVRLDPTVAMRAE